MKLCILSPPMGTIYTPGEITGLIRFYISSCPNCGRFSSDKRYRRRESRTAPCKIYRCSKTSITMQCRNCGLKFNITWHNFAKMLKNLEEIEKGKRKGDLRKDRWKRLGTPDDQVKLLEQYVDVDYSARRPPKSSTGENE